MFKQPFIEVTYGCSDIESTLLSRRNEFENVGNVGTKSCFDVAPTYPMQLCRDVSPKSEFDNETTSFCQLKIHRY